VEASPSRPRRPRRLAANLATLAATLLVLCLLAEAGLRVAGVAYPRFFVPDRWTGVAHVPGASGWFEKEGRQFIRISAQGLRDREHALRKPPRTYRIAVLGDSYAEAFQVPRDSAFWAVMERRLRACPALRGLRPEAINFGVAGYGTAQELLTLRYRARAFEPDAVLLTVTMGNDLRNNSPTLERESPVRPFWVLDHGRMVLDTSFLRSPSYRAHQGWRARRIERLVDRSRLLQLVNAARVNARALTSPQHAQAPAGTLADTQAGLDVAPFLPPPDTAWQNAWTVTEGLVRMTRDEAVGHGALFMAATVSMPAQVHPDAAWRRAYWARHGITDPLYPDHRLQAAGRRDGYHVVALPEVLLPIAERGQVFLHNVEQGGGHWNTLGHRYAGQALADSLCATIASSRR